MKNYIITLVACMALSLGAKAMGYDQARQEALFLTDKMAYELNLSLEQMEAVYEINLDYFLCVNRSQDLYGIYWQRRNSDLRYVLSRNQYSFFININYFYRPLNWVRGAWSLALYGRYTNRHQFFYSRPNAWFSFRGGRNTGGKSHYSYGNYYAPVGNGRPAPGHTPTPSGRSGYQRGNGPHPGYNGNHPNNGNRPYNGYQPGNNGNRPNNGYQPGNNGNYPNNGYQPGNNGNRPNNGYQPGNNGSYPNNGQPNTRPRRSGRP
ncbi:MAG: hypothetical protein II674_07735 [Prevotella sp.]|nr:hypothetical protein [Prevotella sp.]